MMSFEAIRKKKGMYKTNVESTSFCLHPTLAQDLNKKEFTKYYLS